MTPYQILLKLAWSVTFMTEAFLEGLLDIKGVSKLSQQEPSSCL